MGGTKDWEKDHRKEPLHSNEYWYSFLFEMFLNSVGLVFRLVRGIFSAL
ncbi:hypothetical protein [Salinicoccus bachuensis]|uniref:Uncharacterized protein n=1 Tax=Salinicoccus bachuensis TaxID=3136731 RepID=A0ABZ3CH50_9STAP